MLGAIIGDIVGSIYEFHNTKDYDFPILSGDSNYTDDTVMSVAVADWLLADAACGTDTLAATMRRYGHDYRCPRGGYGGMFRRWLADPSMQAYGSWGNGAAMRVSAVGWMFDNLKDTESAAEASAQPSHNHPEGIKGAQATAAAIFMARAKHSKDDIRRYIEERFGYDLGRTYDEVKAVYDWDSSCQGTVPEAIIAFLASSSYEDSIRRAVALGGDSDTLACINGGIAEAFYGSMPDYLVRRAADVLPSGFVAVLRRLAAATAYRLPERLAEPADGQIATPDVPHFTPDVINTLEPGQIFVFGSNLAGAHGGGAARMALNNFGAVMGQGVGLQGQSYAIPTMLGGVEDIKPYVDDFIDFARQHPELVFLVTRVGCGIAGFRDSEMAPLFRAALALPNVSLPRSFCRVLGVE